MGKVIMNTSFLKIVCALSVLSLHSAGFMLAFSWPTMSGEVKCIEKERQALLNFKQGIYLDRGLLSTWKGDEDNGDCCKWKGIECSNQTGRIQMLDLRGSNTQWLSGVINISLLIELQHMEYLDLSYHDFYGSPISELMGSFNNLTYLNLSDSNFGRTIPYELGRLTNLRYLDLGRNYLDGAIPHQFENLTQLRYFDLGGNYLDGVIPYQLGGLSQLRYLDLGGNSLSGAIPFQNGDLPMLQTLRLHGNFDLQIKEHNHVDARWLSSLSSLTTLDLILSRLGSSQHWLQMIGKLLPKLRELRLSRCSLSDIDIVSLFDFHSNVSTSIAILDLSFNMLTSSIFKWLFNFNSNLQELYLSNNNFVMSSPLHLDFPPDLATLDLSNNNLTSSMFQGNFKFGSKLQELYLRNCSLLDSNFLVLPASSNVNSSSSLVFLDLSSNKLKSFTIFHWLLNFTANLHQLDLSVNLLEGLVPEGFGNVMISLEYLDLSYNHLQGEIPTSFGNICTLQSLYLSGNNFSGELSSFIQNCSCGSRRTLQNLDLSRNGITGMLPNFSIFSSLGSLMLSNNRLIGEIPKSIGLLSELTIVDLSGNSLEGDVTELHFSKLSKLYYLDLSRNPLSLKFGRNWVPPFQLISLGLASCKLGPSFPNWLQTQSYLMSIDISNAGLSGAVPKWFWHVSQNMDEMNISYNSLSGIIPNLALKLTKFPILTFTSNQFEGSIPPFLSRAAALHLSQNRFSNLDSLLCGKSTIEALGILDVSNNQLKGQLPHCWNHVSSLEYLDLSSNKLSGKIPFSMGALVNLKALVLRNNSIIGELPSSMKNLTNLVMLDVGENKLSGQIPLWIGESQQQLQILSLRANHFFGSLPTQLCYLTRIKLLDLSENCLSEQILTCLNNFTVMAEMSFNRSETISHNYFSSVYNLSGSYDFYVSLMWKGVEYLFKNPDLLLKSIDLSSNNLTGQMPTEIGSLFGLVSLNLSRNNLNGKITSELGNLKSLEFLDLSRNHFSGAIPSTLAQIDRLSVLDLSNNHLYGKIPIGTQMQSFSASSYEGNVDLCGKPLDKNCSNDEIPMPQVSSVIDHEEEDSIFSEAFYMGLGMGFAVGLWGFLAPILLFRSWRYSYIRFLGKLTDSIYVMVTREMARCHRCLTT